MVRGLLNFFVMKNLIYITAVFHLAIFASCCDNVEEPIQCANGYSTDSNDNCSCPTGNVEAYGQCLPDDNDVLLGVSEGCPCEQDTLLMKILGKTTTPNPFGEYRLNLQCCGYRWVSINTGFDYIPTTSGYDSLIQTVWPLSSRNCVIDGWSCQRKLTGRVYGNDSLVLDFFYTRPNPVTGDIITMPQTCRMVVRN
jgi:hypothetical protein